MRPDASCLQPKLNDDEVIDRREICLMFDEVDRGHLIDKEDLSETHP